MPFLIPPWRSFVHLGSNSESASASACCHFSFGTLEIACCHPGTASFALTEQRRADDWRWAVCNIRGLILRSGRAVTQADAKRAAEEALELEEPKLCVDEAVGRLALV